MAEAAVRPEPVAAAPPPPVPAPPAPSLRDRITVSTSFIAAGVTLLLAILMGPLNFLAPVAGGSFAVYLYRRRTGRMLSVMNAARLGWIAGIVMFTIFAVMVAMLAVSMTQPEIAQQVRDQMSKAAGNGEDTRKYLDLLRSPSGISYLMLQMFAFSTLLMGLGGAMAALFVGRGTADHPHT